MRVLFAGPSSCCSNVRKTSRFGVTQKSILRDVLKGASKLTVYFSARLEDHAYQNIVDYRQDYRKILQEVAEAFPASAPGE